MSEQLSRVKSRQKKKQAKQPVKAKPKDRTNRRTPVESSVVSPKVKPPATLSRTGRRTPEAAESSERGNTGEESTPSRTDTYSSERVRLSKMFVNSLIFLFVLLLGFLLAWGIKGAPTLNE